jgi:citrate lyase subunit beta/citryl-CoA lyase
MDVKPRRSMLYMPGSNIRAMEKAKGLPADCLIMDLEDSVSPDSKKLAREQVRDIISAGGFGPREVLVRINPLDSPWGLDDLLAVACLDIQGIVVPKVEAPHEVRVVAAAAQASGAKEDLGIWAMIETPLAVMNAAAIAGAHPRLTGLLMGTSDLLKEMRASASGARESLITPLTTVVLAARARGLDVIDGVFPDLEDHEGFIKECLQAKRLGFDGKSLIHPRQIEPANEVFSPNQDEVELATEVVRAWEEARAQGRGVVVVRGRMIENLHVQEAKRVLALHEAIKSMGTGP